MTSFIFSWKTWCRRTIFWVNLVKKRLNLSSVPTIPISSKQYSTWHNWTCNKLQKALVLLNHRLSIWVSLAHTICLAWQLMQNILLQKCLTSSRSLSVDQETEDTDTIWIWIKKKMIIGNTSNMFPIASSWRSLLIKPFKINFSKTCWKEVAQINLTFWIVKLLRHFISASTRNKSQLSDRMTNNNLPSARPHKSHNNPYMFTPFGPYSSLRPNGFRCKTKFLMKSSGLSPKTTFFLMKNPTTNQYAKINIYVIARRISRQLPNLVHSLPPTEN